MELSFSGQNYEIGFAENDAANLAMLTSNLSELRILYKQLLQDIKSINSTPRYCLHAAVSESKTRGLNAMNDDGIL